MSTIFTLYVNIVLQFKEVLLCKEWPHGGSSQSVSLSKMSHEYYEANWNRQTGRQDYILIQADALIKRVQRGEKKEQKGTNGAKRG